MATIVGMSLAINAIAWNATGLGRCLGGAGDGSMRSHGRRCCPEQTPNVPCRMLKSCALLIAVATVACSDDASTPPPSSTNDTGTLLDTAVTEAGSDGATTDATATDSKPPSDDFIRTFELAAKAAPYADLRVLTARDSGFLVYGNHQGATSSSGTAFIAKYDDLGKLVWESKLGEGHVARVKSTSDGYLATGYRTVDYDKGAGRAFIASLDDTGKIRLQTDAGAGFARGMGVGTDSTGTIIVAGMEAFSSTSGWDIATFRFKSTGEFIDKKSISYSGRAEYVYDAAIDSLGFAYVSTDLLNLGRIGSDASEVWRGKQNGAVSLGPDDSVYVAMASGIIMHYAKDGATIGAFLRWTTTGGDSRAFPGDLAVDGERVLVAGTIGKRELDGTISSALPIVKVYEAGVAVGGAKFVKDKLAWAHSAALLRSGALVVVGKYRGTLTIGDGSSVSSPSADAYFLARVPVDPSAE